MVTRVPNITVGQDPPVAPDVGDLWWSTVSGIEFIWYEDENATSQWVTTQPGNAGGRPTSAVKIIAGATAVEDAGTGSLLYDNAGVLGAAADVTYDVTPGAGLRITQTWNDAPTTFVPFRISVTATAYAAGSKIFDFLVGGSSKLSLDAVGSLVAQWLTAAHTLSAGEGLYACTDSTLSGTGTQALGFSTADSFGIYFGDGTPTEIAPRGSLYLNAAGVPFYNSDGATDWVVLGSSADQIVVGATNISGGTTTRVLYDNAGVLGEYATIPASVGGTGYSTYAAGDLIYASAINTLSKLAAGTDGHLLTMVGGVPAWSAPPATGVTSLTFGTTGLTPNSVTTGAVSVAGTLVAANGGTGFSTYAAGDLIYASAINTLSKLAAGTDGHILTLAGGVPTWAASTGGVTSFSGGTTGLTPAGVTTGAILLAGTLAVANGGTGVTTSTGTGATVRADSPTFIGTVAAAAIMASGAIAASVATAENGMFVNKQTVAADYTIAAGYNALSAGPVTVNGGITVTVSAGSTWAVV